MLKIRASSTGAIMTGEVGLTDKQSKELQGYYDRDKALTDRMKERVAELEYKRDNPELSKTCITELQKIWIQKKYGRSKDVQTRQMEKGITKEEDAITLLSKVDKSFYVKNEENLENEWLTGTPDIVTDEVIDIKSSWDIHTFFKVQIEDIHKDYYYQLQSYMDLTGLKKARLVYCLVSTPESIISREKDGLMWKGFLYDVKAYKAAEREIDLLSRYDDIPEAERVYQITINRNDEDIQAIHERVELCREYWNQNFKL